MRSSSLVPLIKVSFVALACGSEAPSEAGSGKEGDESAEGAEPAETDGEGDGDGDGDGNETDGALLPSPWETTSSSAFVHLFEWPWTDVATECEEFLGPAGFSAVQVSPPHEHAILRGRPWWERYQPVSYALESRGGTAAEFAEMVDRCAAVGVGIYVDAVINHMTAQASGVGSAGTEFSKYELPGLFGPEDFHSPTCTIIQSDYVEDGAAVQNCELLGLADLDTSSDEVQQTLAGYLIDLISLGVSGFRIDAAKHMSPEDLAGIFAKVDAATDREPFVFLEVIDGGGEAVSSSDYFDLTLGGNPVFITEFKYLGTGERFRAPGDISELALFTPEDWSLLDSDRAVVFTDNHDTQRGDSLSFLDGVSHQLANVFTLAHPYGYPKLMSSYFFTPGSGRDDGPPSTDDGTPLGPHNPAGSPCHTKGQRPFDANTTANLLDGTWICEHRDPALVAMLGFRRATQGAPISHLWTSGEDTLAFAREGKGFVVINNGSSPLEQTLPTGLPSGSYCDVLLYDGPNGCPEDAAIPVDEEGNAAFSVLGKSAVAIYQEQ